MRASFLLSMGCGCNKRKLDTAISADGGGSVGENPNLIAKVGLVILQFMFGVILFSLCFLALIPLFIYVFLGLVTGRDLTVNISKWIRRLSPGKH